MAEPLIITLAALLFLGVMSGAAIALRRQQIDVAGEPPVDRRLFAAAKLGIAVVWTAMILQGWGMPLAPIAVPGIARALAISLWVIGIGMFCVARSNLGDSLRMGSPREKTTLKTGGLYRISRNPIYVGLYLTVAAAALYTLNPLIWAIGLFVIIVHHRIVLAEERFLAAAFPSAYEAYCKRVRRYL